MRPVLRGFFAISALILVGFFIINLQAKSVVRIAEKYGLPDTAHDYLASCRSALHQTNQGFASGRDTLDGCGCVASHITKSHPDDLDQAAGIWLTLVEGVEKDKTPDMMSLVRDMTFQEASTTMKLYKISGDALSLCQ